MKHLLIILISILLLSSPVIGDNHKGETLYRWETSNGIQWKGFGDKETHRQYKGEVENGKLNGLGIMISPYRDKYVGEWKDGKYHGKGTWTLPGGVKYEGEWKDGEKHGQGTTTYSDGSEYVGGWKNDKKHGQGQYNWSDGGKTIGIFREGENWTTKRYDKNGNILWKRVKGKQQ